MSAEMSAVPMWSTIADLVAWLDRSNGRSEHEITLRIVKLFEEAGEAAQARIGMLGQNPRKGATHTSADLADELVDVIVTAMVALSSVTEDPQAVFEAKLQAIADRVAGLEAPDA
jgi:NTP pyrophosphatase (non-canonical NTP hydrolase)